MNGISVTTQLWITTGAIMMFVLTFLTILGHRYLKVLADVTSLLRENRQIANKLQQRDLRQRSRRSRGPTDFSIDPNHDTSPQ